MPAKRKVNSIGRGKGEGVQHIYPIAYIPPTNPLIVT